jgi:hypothetical protein
MSLKNLVLIDKKIKSTAEYETRLMKPVIRFLSAGMFATRPLLRYANAMQLEQKFIPVIIVLSRRRWSLAFRVRV